jgi:type I restriction enzyme R subunit
VNRDFFIGLPSSVKSCQKSPVIAVYQMGKLTERLNALLVLGWRQKAQARAGVRLAIEDGLDEGLPRAYTKETYQTKCNALFEHVYESYMGDGRSSYTEAA